MRWRYSHKYEIQYIIIGPEDHKDPERVIQEAHECGAVRHGQILAWSDDEGEEFHTDPQLRKSLKSLVSKLHDHT